MSEENADSGEKSFEPTQQRLDDARKKGDIPVSRDVAAVAAYLGLALAAISLGVGAAEAVGETLAAFLHRADTLAPALMATGGGAIIVHAARGLGLGLAPLFLIPLLFVALALAAQQAFVFSGQKLAFKASRISPIAQAKQKFGLSGLMEFAKALTKLTLIGVVLTVYLTGEADRMIGAARAAPAAATAVMADVALGLLLRIVAITGIIAAFDYIWQRFNHTRKLRMTHQEVKEEFKRSEGDPHTKSQRRRRGEEIAKNKMMLEVPKADVVIVNPTHYAVALRWRRGEDAAPVVVAKGVDEVAMRIRQVAAESGVPIHSDPPTARAISATVDINQEIEPEHYQPVAAAIRFAEAMRAKARERGI